MALIPKVLSEIKDGPIHLFELYDKLKPELNDATDFLSVMDCLYALRAADINNKGEAFICF
ncbi:ABC-three component system middle component 7 [uncultured Ruminococcus sp.]|uniref:ABC-three component system middle component 7 n=1 Tax=uncultured Ruminococcus sp. TaxID=165186 RepID=UPI00349FC109